MQGFPMITNKVPKTWNQLELMSAEILNKAGFEAVVGKELILPRGTVNVDVYAELNKHGRSLKIICECKNWESPVPKQIVHGFRTVVTESGANAGYIISRSGFQSGANEAAENTNLKLVTWDEFQNEFKSEYYNFYFKQKLDEISEPLCLMCEPLEINDHKDKISKSNIESFQQFQNKYLVLASVCIQHIPTSDILNKGELMLPLSKSIKDIEKYLPPRISEIDNYEEFLDELMIIVETAQKEFEGVLGEI